MNTEIKEISSGEAFKIIENRYPLGLFYVKEGQTYTGIDNTDGNAWTEDFETYEAVKNWLCNNY